MSRHFYTEDAPDQIADRQDLSCDDDLARKRSQAVAVLTPEQARARVVAEIERRWRSRTPATRIDEVDPGSRVSRGEMRLWAQQAGVPYSDMDRDLARDTERLFLRLRREFPNEKWQKRDQLHSVLLQDRAAVRRRNKYGSN